jgi:phage/plasmid-associated DNA primase
MRADYWSHPDRRAGVIAWLLHGLIRLRERGKLLTPQAYKEDKESALGEANPIEQWLRENITTGDSGSFIATADIMRKVEIGDMSIRIFQMHLPKYMGRLFRTTKSRMRTELGQVNGYKGVRWIEDE